MPLTNIDISHLCPAPLHIILSIGKFLKSMLEKVCNLEEIYAALGIKKDAHTQQLTGLKILKSLLFFVLRKLC